MSFPHDNDWWVKWCHFSLITCLPFSLHITTTRSSRIKLSWSKMLHMVVSFQDVNRKKKVWFSSLKPDFYKTSFLQLVQYVHTSPHRLIQRTLKDKTSVTKNGLFSKVSSASTQICRRHLVGVFSNQFWKEINK